MRLFATLPRKDIEGSYLEFDGLKLSIVNESGVIKDDVLEEYNIPSFEKEFLSVDDIASHLQVSRQTVINTFSEKDRFGNALLPHIRIGRSYRVRATDYLLFLNRRYNK